MNVAPAFLPGLHDRPVAAFDGDDTLWIDSTEEQEWERRFKHLAADRLPHREMSDRFHAHLNDTSFTIDARARCAARQRARDMRRRAAA